MITGPTLNCDFNNTYTCGYEIDGQQDFKWARTQGNLIDHVLAPKKDLWGSSLGI